MPLITLNAVDYSVGGPLLLEKVELSIESGERIALIGRNGAGKSTLVKVIASQLQISEDTIKGHLRSIMDKLGANNRTHAVAIGVQRGFVEL